MTRSELINYIQHKRSFLCIGLDTDLSKLPPHLLAYKDPLYIFNRAIIEATADLAVAYKPNFAFYEQYGLEGLRALEQTMKHFDANHFTIADAKRGDIGNTATMYARAFFETWGFDAVTVAPYMGADSVQPFLEYPNKWAIVLALTSNGGSADFQHTLQEQGEPLYEKVMRKVMDWGSADRVMFVCGATHPDKFAALRAIAPEYFFLVPGVGAQGGSLADVAGGGMTTGGGLLVNASRSILYASGGKDFAEAARREALVLQEQMSGWVQMRMLDA
jgi:orotidine-5'-phosphate decarboxylase